MEDRQSNESSPVTPKKRVGWFRKTVRVFGYGILGYIVVVVLGLIPVNNGFKPATEGRTIYVYSGSVHSDLILPTSNSDIDWREHFPEQDFGTKVARLSHVSIGWGDRGFFLETPEWENLKATTAANAMFLPSSTVMHVRFRSRPAESSRCKAVTISEEAYAELVEFVLTSFSRSESDALHPIAREYAYGRTDSFYEASGNYHALNTCNCWVGRGLKRAGVRVPVFTPLPRTVLLYLPDE